MEVTEVRVKLVDRGSDRLKAFCTVTFDNEFVVRDLKIIEGPDGLFVAMPSRKLTDHCPRCGMKNHLRAAFCNECGAKLSSERTGTDSHGRAKLHADVAHPINPGCREKVQAAVVKAFEAEVEASRQPGYRPRDLDVDEDYDDLVRAMARGDRARSAPAPQPKIDPKPGEAFSPGAGLT